MAGRRLLENVPVLTRRAWEDVAPQLQRFLERLWASESSGLPSGNGTDIPTTIEVGDIGSAGTATDGWAAISHEHPVLTGAPSDLADSAQEGSSTRVPRLDHKHKRSVRVMAAGVDVGTRNAIDFRDANFSVVDNPGGDTVQISGNILEAAKPTLKRVQLSLSAAQVRTLFSSPQTLVAATAGVAHIPELISYVRAAGTAYTMGAAGNMLVRMNSVNYDAFASSSLLNGAGPYRRVTLDINGGAAPYGAFGVTTATRDDTNQAVTLSIATADVTGGTGGLDVVMYYRSWPVTQM